MPNNFKKIVGHLPALESAQPINLNQKSELSQELKSSLMSYLKHYDLPSYNNENISLTIGKFQAFEFELVAQIYQKKLTDFNTSSNNIKGIVVFIHGYLDHFGLYKYFIKYLIDNNYIVVGLDLPGHGLSTGKIAHIVDFGQYAHTIEILVGIIKNKFSMLNVPYYLSGFSAGAAIGTEYLLRNYNNTVFTKALWLAPLLRVPKWKYTQIACYLLPFIKYVPRQTKNTSHNSAFVTFIKFNDRLQPRFLPLQWIKALHHWVARLPKYKPLEIDTCIIQGTQDKTIDWRFNIPNLAKIYLNHRVHYIVDGYHSLINESPKYRDDTLKFITRFFNCDS